jgi:hypothetical protein
MLKNHNVFKFFSTILLALLLLSLSCSSTSGDAQIATVKASVLGPRDPDGWYGQVVLSGNLDIGLAVTPVNVQPNEVYWILCKSPTGYHYTDAMVQWSSSDLAGPASTERNVNSIAIGQQAKIKSVDIYIPADDVEVAKLVTAYNDQCVSYSKSHPFDTFVASADYVNNLCKQYLVFSIMTNADYMSYANSIIFGSTTP